MFKSTLFVASIENFQCLHATEHLLTHFNFIKLLNSRFISDNCNFFKSFTAAFVEIFNET